MDKELEEYIESLGFIVYCYSPLEIIHVESDSRATGHCAELIIESISSARQGKVED